MTKVHSLTFLQNTLEHTLLHNLLSGVQLAKYIFMYFNIKYNWVNISLVRLLSIAKQISKTSTVSIQWLQLVAFSENSQTNYLTDVPPRVLFVHFTSGGNLQHKLYSKVHSQNTLKCNLFPKVLSDVLFANYIQRHFQKWLHWLDIVWLVSLLVC